MRNIVLAVCIALLSTIAIAQQTVTTSGGTTNTIPKFSGSTSIVNSALSETNGNLQIGPDGYVSGGDPFFSGTVSLTGSCCTIDATHGGYGTWIGYNGFFNGSDWIQSQGGLQTYLFTANYHAGGWAWYTAAATGTNGASFTPVEVASMDSKGRLKLSGGIDSSGSGIKHARAGGCSTTNPSCSVTVSWSGTAFSDTNYTAVCTPDSANGILSITGKTTGSVTVTITGLNGVTVGGVECMAMHD